MAQERVQSEGIERMSVEVAHNPVEAPAAASPERSRRRTRPMGTPPATAKRQRRPLGARGQGPDAPDSAEDQAKIDLSNALITKYSSLVRQIAGGFQRKLPRNVLRDDLIAAGMSGSSGDYTWSTVNPPTGTWNDPPNDSTRTGIDRLLWDFIYGVDEFTTTLAGLTPGKAYECRLYFRNFANNPRRTTFTFTAGAHQVGELFYNPDSGAIGSRSWVGCRYTADASGTLAIRVVSHVSAHKCHFYGLSNEELPSTAAPALTVAPAAAAEARFTGNVTGLGTLTKNGDGTQRFGGAIALPVPLAVQAGTAVLDQGADLPNGAAIAAALVSSSVISPTRPIEIVAPGSAVAAPVAS